MPYININGIRLAYERSGRGERVLLIMGSGARGGVWTMFQVPALNRAGYETVTFDNRGIAPSDAPPGMYTLAEMVADTTGLIEALGAGPCRLIGTSLGATIAAEVAASRPDLVLSCVLIAARARGDAIRRALSAADLALADSAVELPASYEAAMSVIQMFSPTTLNDDAAVSMWLDLFEVSSRRRAVASGQAGVDVTSDKRETLRAVTVPCRVIAFSDDMICPPHLGVEIADAIPDCDFVEIGSCGHLGYLEKPDEVNSAILEFLERTDALSGGVQLRRCAS
jgi:pimeloyl-ACP methyl ester carboxylesterase